jgi:hypothetical protein
MAHGAPIVDGNLVRRYARRFAESNMTASVRVTRMDSPNFDDIDGLLTAITGDLVYEGPGRVYGVAGPVQMALGEEPQYFSSTYVSIPLASDQPRVDDVVEVLEHSDASMVGRKFRVQDVEAGGQFPATRRMQVMGVQRSKQWTDHPSVPRDIPDEWRV